MQTVLFDPEPVYRLLENHWMMVAAEILVLTSIPVFADTMMKRAGLSAAGTSGIDLTRTMRLVRFGIGSLRNRRRARS